MTVPPREPNPGRPVRRRYRDQGGVSVLRLLATAFTILIGLIVAGGAIGVLITAPVYRSTIAGIADVVETRLANQDVRATIVRAETALHAYLLSYRPEYLDTYESARDAYPREMAELYDAARPDESALAAEVDQNAQAWWSAADRLAATTAGTGLPPDEIVYERLHFEIAVAATAAVDQSLTERATSLHQRLRRVQTWTIVVIAGMTVLGAAAAVVIATVVTRRITRPLSEVVRGLDRLASGDYEARVAALNAPAEIEAVAAAVNDATDWVVHERRLGGAMRRLGVAVRQHQSSVGAVETAIRGLGELLQADHVVLRPVTGEGEAIGPAVWSAPDAPGNPTALTRTGVDWLELDESAFVIDRIPINGDMPAQERAALHDAHAGPTVTVDFDEGDAHRHLTLVRRPGRPRWTRFEVRLAETLAVDLGGALVNAKIREHDRELVARLREVDATKTEFLSTVSHELRTPLTSIDGYLEVLLDEDIGPLTGAQQRMLDVIARNTKGLQNLIEDLLLVSRIESGGGSNRRTVDVDAGSLIAAAEQAIRPEADVREVDLTSDVHGPLPVRGDPDQLDRVLMNLLSNAVKFTQPGGEVTVTGRAQDSDVVISVRDTGIGIPAAEVPQLFKRFFRATNATEKAVPGTGLGLAIVSAVVEHHHGTVALESQEGTGTTVTVRLPSCP